MSQRRRLWVLACTVAILLYASTLYLHDLNAISFWEDESWMAIAIRGDLPGVWRFAAERGVHPPLYFTLAWGYARLAGDGELALRWFGGMWALVGIAFTYRLGADLYDRKAGVFAALLTAGSLFLLYFARNARHYTLFFTLAAAVAWAYVRWRRQPGSGRWLAAIALLQAALLYTHYFGAWMAAVIALHGLVSSRLVRRAFLPHPRPLSKHGEGRRTAGFLAFLPSPAGGGRVGDGGLPISDWLRLVGALVAGGVLFLPWAPSALHQFRTSPGGLGYAVAGTQAALGSYLDAIFNANYWMSLPMLALGLIATWRGRRVSAGLLLALWLALPVGLSLAINARFQWFVSRNLLFTLGAVSVLFGAGLSWLAESRPGRRAAMLAAVVFAAAGPVVYPKFWSVITPNWREAARQMAADARPDDLFVLRAEPYSLDYYLSRYLGQVVEITRFEDWMIHPVTPDRIWLIDGDWAVRFEAIDALAPSMALTRRPVVAPIVAELYQRPPEMTLTVFGDTFALATTTLLEDLKAEPGKTLTVELWWKAVRPPEFDYSTGVYLVAPDGTVVAQNNGPFDRGRVNATALPLDQWTPDERRLALPADLKPGEYALLVGVYDWRDGARLRPSKGREDDLYLLARVSSAGG